MTTERVQGLEGFRGIAAFIVFIHHFLIIFHPDYYFGEHTTINKFINADLAVTWFFIHSGFVLSLKPLHNPLEAKNILWSQTKRRYLRLMIPVMASVLFCTCNF